MGHDGRASFRSRRTLAQAVVLLAVCAAAWPLLSHGGLLNTRGGGDSPFLLQRVHQLVTAVHDGHFPVRWMPDANYGFGYPFFNYYAPLSIYVAALFRLLGFGYVHAIQLAQWLGFLVAACAVFRLASRWLESEWAGLLAAVAYTVAPFHMVNVYVRGDSLAEFWAMALYPTVLLAADELMTADGAQKRHVVLLAVSYAALILAHNISALIFTPFLLLYILLRADRSGRSPRRFAHNVSAPVLALILGLALSAWFWLPALAEKGVAQLEPVTTGYFHFSNHFWNADLVQRSFLFDYDVAGRNAFRMGLVQTAAIFLGLVALLWHRVRARTDRVRPASLTAPPYAFTVVALFVATFMITPLSRPLWEALPLLSFTQFPWRFLSVQALAGAIVTGALALLPGRRLLVPVAVTLLLATSLGRLEPDHLTLTEDDVTPERLVHYEWFTGNIGSTVSAEYLPRTVQPRPYTSAWIEEGERNRTQILAGEATAQLIERRTTTQTWEVRAGDGGATLVLPTGYWPGWAASADGGELAIRPAPGSGLITVDVPAGEHTLTLALGRTPVRLAAEWLSLAAVVIAGVVLATGSGRRPDGWPQRSLAFFASNLFFFLLPIVLLALFLGLRPAPAATNAPPTWDFAQMAYLHPAPDGVLFDNGVRLEGYQYEKEVVSAGETLQVTVEWSGTTAGATTAMLELVTPAVHRFPHALPLLARSRSLAEVTAFTLDIPTDAPAGLYTPRLTIEGARPLLPSGQTRGNLSLRPLHIVRPAGGQPEGSAERPLMVQAERVALSGQSPGIGESDGLFNCAEGGGTAGRLSIHLSWRTATPLSSNYTTSLRLTDAAGVELAQCDVQPGYGYQPSSLWPAGQWVHDRLALPLPESLPAAAPYALVVRLYDAQGRATLTRRLGELDWEGDGLAFRRTQLTYSLPEDVITAAASFADVIALRGYRLERGPERLALTLYWEALAAGRADYVRFVHLVNPATGQIVQRDDGTPVQADSMPRNGSYPTSQWTAGEVVADPLTFTLDEVPAGHYQLAVGFYPPEDPLSRLAVTDAQGDSQPDNRLLLPAHVIVGGE